MVCRCVLFVVCRLSVRVVVDVFFCFSFSLFAACCLVCVVPLFAGRCLRLLVWC